jgi:hypothetical protein
METIINENSRQQSTKTSENICDDVPSALRKQNRTSFSSSSFVSSRQANKQDQKSFSSLKSLSRRTYSNRRSTINCSKLLNNDENDESLSKSQSHQSIDIIKENSSDQFLYEDTLSKSNQNSTPTTTRIKLSLPVISSGLNPRRRFLNKTQQGEFTLPTNPPITVTIQPQTNLNNNIIRKESSLHDDQLCSPEHIHHIINQERISLDPSLKGTSTIVNYFMDLLKPSDNKLAMKLFGSRKGVLKERLRQQRAGHCIIHPCSNFR